MRSPLTPSLALLTLLAPLAAASQTAPLPSGGYATSRAVLEDYVACAAEARLLRVAVDETAAAGRQAVRAAEASRTEADALRGALGGAELALNACDARRTVAQAEAGALREAVAEADARADRADRARGRWRTLAFVGPAAGALAVLLLTR